MADKNSSYSAKDIQVLEGLEPVRKRPGMYIGSTGIEGLHHLIWEVVDNSLDEASAGFGNRIEVVLLPKNRVKVVDNGRGIPVDNALSVWMRVEVCRDGGLYAQEYSKGKPKTAVKKQGKCKETGTTVIFEPDPEVFKKIEFKWLRLLKHLRQQAYLTKGVRIIIRDERKSKAPREYSFYFEGGIISYVRYLNSSNQPKHDNIFYVSKEFDEILVEV